MFLLIRSISVYSPLFSVLLLLGSCATLNTNDNDQTYLDDLHTSAVQGDIDSTLALAQIYREGKLLPIDVAASLQWYEKAAAYGSAIGQLEAAKYLLKRTPSSKSSLTKSGKYLEQSANQDNPEAQFLLATQLITHYQDNQRIDLAFYWFQRAANHGRADAQYMLGRMFMNGSGTEKNIALAVKWLQEAAKNGDSRAQLGVGDLYLTGTGLSEDASKAMSWYEESALQGSFRAQSNMGDLLTIPSYGLQLNISAGLNWYSLAAQQGYSHAQYRMAKLQLESSSFLDSNEESIQTLTRSANQGYGPAQCHLGSLYYTGNIVRQNLTDADYWFNKAAAQAPAGILPLLGFVHYDCNQFESQSLKLSSSLK